MFSHDKLQCCYYIHQMYKKLNFQKKIELNDLYSAKLEDQFDTKYM